jgi:hypothetical protein
LKIKLIKPYGFSSVGDVLDIPVGVAQLLIQRKIAEVYEERISSDWTKRLIQPPAHRREQRGRK